MTADVTFLPTMPAGLIDGLHDTGRWRDVGITHWHLWVHETSVYHRDRFVKDVVAARIAAGRPTADPREAVEWVFTQHLQAVYRAASPQRCATRRGWTDLTAFTTSIVTSWELMTERPHLLTPIGGGLEVRDGWTVDVYAEPMTAARCRRH